MKIAFDVDVIKDLGITRMVHQVAEWGYKYIEQSPHPQINPFYKHPRASREIMAEYKQALRDTGLELSSFICVYRWSGPDELRRQAAVKNWKRLVEIAVEMGVQVINTEFSGDPNQPEICDEMFYRSMEELLPIFEREGIRVEIQAHPWDFCEENNETVDIVKSFRSDNVKYVYSYGFATGLVRAVTAVPGHAIFGVFMGYFYGYAKLSDYWGRDEDRKAYLALSVVVPILLHGCYDFLAFAQEGDSRFTLLFYAYLIALYVFGIRRVNRSSRDDRRVTRETVFDYFRRMQYPLPPQYRDRNDDFWR